MLLIKITLSILIFITSTFLGFVYGGKYSKRVYSLISLQQSIRLLEAEVIIFSNPLPDALMNISKRASGDIATIFLSIKEDLVNNQTGDIFYSFLSVVDYLKEDYLLKSEDIELFLSLGKVIGKTDRFDQERQFTYVIEQLDIQISEAKDERVRNEKMYRSLGVLLGLGMIIILI